MQELETLQNFEEIRGQLTAAPRYKALYLLFPWRLMVNIPGQEDKIEGYGQVVKTQE